MPVSVIIVTAMLSNIFVLLLIALGESCLQLFRTSWLINVHSGSLILAARPSSHHTNDATKSFSSTSTSDLNALPACGACCNKSRIEWNNLITLSRCFCYGWNLFMAHEWLSFCVIQRFHLRWLKSVRRLCIMHVLDLRVRLNLWS